MIAVAPLVATDCPAQVKARTIASSEERPATSSSR